MFNLTAQSMLAFDLWVVSSNHTCTFLLILWFLVCLVLFSICAIVEQRINAG